ncbi:MAG: AMP-binding protein [Elusimicrobiota bacterium]
MQVSDILKKSSIKFPEKEALITDTNQFTYAELQEMVEQFASALQDSGVKKGDRVGILMRNTYEAVVTYCAILKIGAVEVALNIIADTQSDVEYKVRDCEISTLVVSGRYLKNAMQALNRLNIVKNIFYLGEDRLFTNLKQKCISLNEVFATYERNTVDVSIDGTDLASIAYTSGTTGQPKGVMLTHNNMFSGAEVMSMVTPDERTMLLVPLFHTYGKAVVNSRFMRGATIVLVENIVFPMEVLKMVEISKSSSIIVVPTILKMLLHVLKEEKKDFGFSNVKYIVSGGARLPVETLKEYWQLYPRLGVQSGYGLTEISGKASGIYYTGAGTSAELLESCGSVIYGHERRIVDDSGNDVPLGEVGEVIFKGSSVMKGYWNKKKETSEAIRNNWLYTGDIGRVDENNNLYLIDRKKDIIKSGGELISPKEIEIVLNTHPMVEESAVIGVENEVLGEVLKAFIVTKDGLQVDEEDIIKHCSKQLPPIKIPISVEFLISFPKSSLDKVKKSELKRRYCNAK